MGNRRNYAATACLLVAATFCFFQSRPSGASANAYESYNAIPEILRRSLNAPMSLETYLKHIRSELRQDGRTEITKSGFEDELMHQLAQEKVGRIVFYDLDHDTNVTKEEIEKSNTFCWSSADSPAEVTSGCGAPPKKEVDDIMRADTDHNGVISYKEMWQVTDDDISRGTTLGRFDELKNLVALDPNGDDKLTLQELEDVARKAFATVDKDGDEVFTLEEKKIAQGQKPEADKPYIDNYTDRCSLGSPDIPDNLMIVGAGAYSGKPMAQRIDKGGKAGEFTVTVNSKDRPVALILGAYDASVWHIRHTKGTVIHSVVAGGFYRQVVVGLEKDVPVLTSYYGVRPTSDDPSDGNDTCGYFYFTKTESKELNPLSRHFFKKPADLFIPANLDGQINVGEAPSPSEEIVSASYTRKDIVPDEDAIMTFFERGERDGILRHATQTDADAWLDALEAKERANPTVDIVKLPDGKDTLRDSLPSIEMRFGNAYVLLKEATITHDGERAYYIVPKGVSPPKGASYVGVYDMNTVSCYGTMIETFSDKPVKCRGREQ